MRKVYIYQRFVRHIRKSWQPVEAIELLDHVAVLAERIGVSDTTIINLCADLGYSGFAAFKRAVRKELQQEKDDLTSGEQGTEN